MGPKRFWSFQETGPMTDLCLTGMEIVHDSKPEIPVLISIILDFRIFIFELFAESFDHFTKSIKIYCT